MREIGKIFTPYGSKFGAPKQSGLARKDESSIVLSEEFTLQSTRGMKADAFIWVLFHFHQCEGKYKELVRPPKLGGNEKMGVLATRSPFRPNNIGLSLLKLLEVKKEKGRVVLAVQGADMVSGTPVLDVKPYHKKADAPWESSPDGWHEENPDIPMQVAFSKGLDLEASFRDLVEEVLALDPRPAYHDDMDRVYVNELEKRHVYWKAKNAHSFEVFKVEKTND